MPRILSAFILFTIFFANFTRKRSKLIFILFDKATRNNSFIRFNVYNPTDRSIIITGIKYYKGDTNSGESIAIFIKQLAIKEIKNLRIM